MFYSRLTERVCCMYFVCLKLHFYYGKFHNIQKFKENTIKSYVLSLNYCEYIDNLVFLCSPSHLKLT